MSEERREKLTDQLRAAIEASELSKYRIGLMAHVDHGTLSRFMHKKGNLSSRNIDAIAEVLGLELAARRRPKMKGR